MKRTLTIIALAVAAFGASAQDSSSTSGSASNSGANSTASQNTNNSVNASQSDSASASRAASGSVSGATGNTVIFNPSSAGATAQGAGGIPTTRVINERSGTDRTEQVLSGTTTANQNSTMSGGTTNANTNTDNVHYSGVVENKSSGGTYNVLESRVSGSQTIRSAPAIAMSGPASGPCTGVSGGVAGSGIGWGFGVNMSSVMDDCRMRENTRVLGMAMQSLDGGTNPQEKGEVTVIFMDAVRALGQYNQSIYAAQQQKAK